MKASDTAGIAVLLLLNLAGCCFGSQELKCGEQCHCWLQTKEILQEYRIICNETDSKPVKLTGEIFAQADSKVTFQMYVRVHNFNHLTVTESFIDTWKRFGSCSLDVWSVNHVVIDKVHPSSMRGDTWHHVFAGIGISDSTLNSFPDGLFSGKKRAGIRLTRAYVGIIHPRVFSDVQILKYLQVENSHIGIIQGSEQTGKLLLEKNEEVYPILFRNSVVGQMQEGAINVKSNDILELFFDNVTIGEVKTNGISISGVKFILSNSRVADMNPKALDVQGPDSSITINNSQLIAQPGALSQLQCSFHHHNINTNEILVRSSIPQILEPSTEDQDNNRTTGNSSTTTKQKLTLIDLISAKLSKVLHPSCVRYNLPQWFRNYNNRRAHTATLTPLPPQPQPVKKNSKVLQIGLYSFIGISIGGIILVFVLVCILINTRNRRGQRVPFDSPTIIMSQLPDPIYDEATNFLLPGPPPPVPPPVMVYCGEKGDLRSDCCSATMSRSGCNGEASRSTKVENNYVTMR